MFDIKNGAGRIKRFYKRTRWNDWWINEGEKNLSSGDWVEKV